MSSQDDVLRIVKCVECDFGILGEPPLLGPYGFVHAKCLPDGWPV